MNDQLELDLDSEDFDSIGGLIIDQLGRLPEKNDQVILANGIVLQVKKLDKNRIEEVRLLLPEPQEEKEDENRQAFALAYFDLLTGCGLAWAACWAACSAAFGLLLVF